MARTKQTARKFSKRPVEGTFGYSCTLYKDFLIFFGGTYDGDNIPKASVYNLEEERIEINQPVRNKSIEFDGKFGHSACYYEPENVIIFFGGEPSPGGYEDAFCNPALILSSEGDGLSWHLKTGIAGPAMESPIGHVYENKLFMYQPGNDNRNFGILRYYDFPSKTWQEPHRNYDLRLKTPCDKAIFVQNKLYLFAESDYPAQRTMTRDGCFIEDVYVLDISAEGSEWEKISFSGQAPGLVSHVSMAEANGVVYIFGLSYNKGRDVESVLWTFDTNEEKWSIVQDTTEILTARPNQRAVIYKGKLLIIDWDFLTQTLGIQYHILSGDIGNFISQSPSGKALCKDQDDTFIQDAKSLYNSKLFPDVVFEIEGEEIPAHKALLAYRSDYFMKMFTSGMSESHRTKIPISNMKPYIFKAILQYVYCNELELDEQLALDLIPVIDEYLMKGLKGLCEKYLCKQLRKDNVVDMLIVADRHEIQDLKKACFKFILKNLASMDENEEIMKLSKSLFLELLKFNTPGLQQKGKSEKKEDEETKSNSVFGMNYGSTKTTGFGSTYMPTSPAYIPSTRAYTPKTPTTPTYTPASPVYMPTTQAAFSRATRAAPRSKSRSRSPVQIVKRVER